MNHFRHSNDPRCSELRSELMFQYPTTLINSPAGSTSAPYSTTPDIEMLDVSNEEPPPHSDIFPSPSHEDIYMSIDENDKNDDNHDTDNATDDEGEDEDNIFEGGGGYIDQSLETVSCHPPRKTAATDDSDTDPEISDDEEELQQELLSRWPDLQNPRHSGPLSTQSGGWFYSVIDPLLTSFQSTKPHYG